MATFAEWKRRISDEFRSKPIDSTAKVVGLAVLIGGLLIGVAGVVVTTLGPLTVFNLIITLSVMSFILWVGLRKVRGNLFLRLLQPWYSLIVLASLSYPRWLQLTPVPATTPESIWFWVGPLTILLHGIAGILLILQIRIVPTTQAIVILNIEKGMKLIRLIRFLRKRLACLEAEARERPKRQEWPP